MLKLYKEIKVEKFNKMVMKISFVVVVMSIALCSLAEDHPQEISGINLDLLHEDTTGI